MLFVPGSDYMTAEAEADTVHQNHDVLNFTQMPPFRRSDVQTACGNMHSYLAVEPDTLPSMITHKQARLVARTAELLAALKRNGKLTADGPAFSATDCAR